MKYLLASVITMFCLLCSAQFDQTYRVYLTGGLSAGNYWGFTSGINTNVGDDWVLRLGRSGNKRVSRNLPDDYYFGLSGLSTLCIVCESSFAPYDRFTNYHLSLGRKIPISEDQKLRLTLFLGFGLATIEEATDWKEVGSFLGLSPNYDYSYELNREWSMVLHPRFEYIGIDQGGLYLMPIIEISPSRTSYGLGGGLIFGVLKKKQKSLNIDK